MEATMSDAVVVAEVAVHRFQTVVGLPGDLVRFFAFGISLPADDAFVSQAGADVVQGGPTRDEFLGFPFMGRQDMGDLRVVSVEDLGEVAVRQESPLLVSLSAQA